MVPANALQFHGRTHNFTQDFTPMGPFSSGLISNLSTQFVHPALYNLPRMILIFIPKSFSIDALGHLSTKKTPAFSSFFSKEKWHHSEVHIFSQLWPVHMIRTFKGIIHLMASSPPFFFRNPQRRAGHHVLKGRWGMLGWPCHYMTLDSWMILD